jgi:hypothetical protein
MLNLCYNFLAQGLDGVYISFEMRDRKVARRTDQIIASLSSGLISPNRAQVAGEIEKFHEKSGARFFIKRMREGSTSNDILAYLRLLESRKKFRPKFICADYLDIMDTVRRGVGDSLFLKDKYVAEEFRAIGFDYNSIQISASQLQKHATEAIEEGRKMHQGDVMGSSGKTHTADLMIAAVKTDAMHSEGVYRFEFPKARNSDASTKVVTMGWNKTTLRISDLGSELQLKKKTMEMQAVQPGAKKPNLDDLAKKFEKGLK